MNLDFTWVARTRGYGTRDVVKCIFYAVARRWYRGRLVIFSAASCHEKDTGSFISRDLLTPSRERERDGDTQSNKERGRERGAFFHFISYIKRTCVGVSHLVS